MIDAGDFDLVFEEILGESRSFTISRDSVSKEFTFVVSSNMFLKFAETAPLPGTDFTMIFDDNIVQQKIIPLFQGEIPLSYLFMISETQGVLLYAASITATQLSWETWKLQVTYDLPPDNGESNGGGGGSTGPSDGEQNSEKFTQLSFNTGVTTERIQRAKVVEIQKSVANPVTALPLAVNTVALIGESDEGVEGADVYKRTFKFQITQYMPPTKLTYSYVRRLSRLTTTINDKPFFGFAAGSVMFVGGSGDGDIFHTVPVTLEYEVQPNFVFSQTLPDLPATPEDEIAFVSGVKTIVTRNQRDRIFEPEFPDTIAAALPENLEDPPIEGTHSGWSIISYLYNSQINTGSKKVLRIPSHRVIYQHYFFMDFNFFEL